MQANILTKAGAFAGVGHQQTAQHPDGCCFATPVRAEKSENLTALHIQINTIDNNLALEAFGQAADRYHGFRIHGCCASTITGCPGVSEPVSFFSVASIRQTSLAFVSRL